MRNFIQPLFIDLSVGWLLTDLADHEGTEQEQLLGRPKSTHARIWPCAVPFFILVSGEWLRGRVGGGGEGGGRGVITTMFHKPTHNHAIYGVFACLYIMSSRMFDVQICSATRGAVTNVQDICEHAPLLFTAFLPLYTTCCKRMLDVQQHVVLSQVFIPFCKYAQNPAIYSDFAALYNVCVIESSAAGSGTRSWIPKRMSRITWGTCAKMSARILSPWLS